MQSENQKLKLKIISFQTENQPLKRECDQQVKARDNKINLLESEKRAYHSTSIQQMQTLNSLRQDNQTAEQDKRNIIYEMERLRASYTTLEQLLKLKEDTIVSLNRENQILSTANHGNQQGANDMVETLKSLFQDKNSEIELLKQNMDHLLANEQQRNDALVQENQLLKQGRTQQQTTLPNTNPLNDNINPINSDPNNHNQHDDSYNVINYETEDSVTEEGDTDDINYDTPSEDEDINNDLNCDDAK
jgi:hypothetical protein